ncbi:hypothetical protein HMPREF1012_02314 [Bacillus sp. BT1B_CT2]|uniref:hypothetical protein n=1 Tax=Bacillus TaxID=1386 RepID=UPI0001F4464E|nr:MULTISPECIES: hypothetical protein [Bacillus]EFV71675.1 hypothetical protein HMPREF1012_02314 [Bacillus sp. BT1B_CT2]MEC3835419.1 hypothetical protein [Bacillus licheniformis]
MIHTFKFYIPLHYQEVQDLQKRFNIKYTELNRYFAGKFPSVTMAISNSGNGQWKLYMVVDAIKLIGKPNITEADYESIEKELKYILWHVVGYSSHFKEHILLRIDFRFDVPIKDKSIRMLLMTLYKKQTKSYRFQKKYLGKLTNGVFVPYKTTVYHSSNSIESMVYLKSEEREAKGEKIEDYERDVIRYEIHVMEDHLYYMEKKKEKNQRPRKLAAYLKEDVYKDYFRKYMSQIYHPGDFYKIDAARKKLKSSALPTKDKLKLIEFLKQVSSNSIDTPLKKMSKGTFKSRLALLREVGINPVLIPKNYQSNSPVPSTLKNPLNDFPW